MYLALFLFLDFLSLSNHEAMVFRRERVICEKKYFVAMGCITSLYIFESVP